MNGLQQHRYGRYSDPTGNVAHDESILKWHKFLGSGQQSLRQKSAKLWIRLNMSITTFFSIFRAAVEEIMMAKWKGHCTYVKTSLFLKTTVPQQAGWTYIKCQLLVCDIFCYSISLKPEVKLLGAELLFRPVVAQWRGVRTHILSLSPSVCVCVRQPLSHFYYALKAAT